MESEKLIAHLSQMYPLSQAFYQTVKDLIQIKRYEKGVIIDSPGQNATLWFINKGLIKSFYDDDEGKEHIQHFWQEDEILLQSGTDPARPSVNLQIMMLEDSYLSFLSSRHSHYLYHKFSEAAKLASKILLIEKRKSEIKAHHKSLSAFDAYSTLSSVIPFERIKLKDIACYLDITPSTLSEIRRREKGT